MAEPLGDWTWERKSNRLRLDVTDKTFAAKLGGEWGIQEFGVLLHGLSRRQFSRVFETRSGIVSCPLTLADGRTVHMVGAFDDETGGQGLLLSEPVIREGNRAPGPALVPVFQPIYSLQSETIAGFEALARWPGPEGAGDESRYDDQALASNMMIHACQALSQWFELPGGSDLFVQVNLTARDLSDPKLVDLVSALIDGYRLPKGALRLELTEQAALRDLDQAISVTHALQEAGAALVLDDFGTGHSSFLWLARLPADSLKIDYELISRLENERVRTILETLTLLARRLDMRTTAEGVEDISKLKALQEMGFDYAQGFALGVPVIASKATEMLRSTRATAAT